jgi:hypothetical protein
MTNLTEKRFNSFSLQMPSGEIQRNGRPRGRRCGANRAGDEEEEIAAVTIQLSLVSAAAGGADWTMPATLPRLIFTRTLSAISTVRTVSSSPVTRP